MLWWYILPIFAVGFFMWGAIKLTNHMKWKHPESTPMFLNRRIPDRNQMGLADQVPPPEEDGFHTVEKEH